MRGRLLAGICEEEEKGNMKEDKHSCRRYTDGFQRINRTGKILKKLYQGQYREILSVPMQYATYQKLMKEHRCI